MTRYEKWSSCPMLSLLLLNLGQVAKPALNTKGTQAETTVFKGKTKTTERVNVSLPGPMPRKTWTLYVMRTTKHRTRNRTILSVLRLVGLKYIYIKILNGPANKRFQKPYWLSCWLSSLFRGYFRGLRFGFCEGTCFLFNFPGTFAATRFAGVFAFAAIDFCGYFCDPFATPSRPAFWLSRTQQS